MKRVTVLFLAASAAVIGFGAADGIAQQQACSTVIDCAQKAMEAAYQAKLALAVAVPRGAVMAFDLPECPKGWSKFDALAGRVVVGAGEGDGLSPRKLGDKAGEERHKLTTDEMPSHTHEYETERGEDGHRNGGPQDGTFQRLNKRTGGAGGDQPHNVMQPYLVLTYCRRE